MTKVEIEKKHGNFEKQEIEKLEARLKNLSAGNTNPSSSDKPTESIATNSNQKKLDPADEIMQKLLKEAEEIHKKSFNDEVKIFIFYNKLNSKQLYILC